MLNEFEARSWSKGFEARFVAAQQDDARTSFEERNRIRMQKELALIERDIDVEKQNL